VRSVFKTCGASICIESEKCALILLSKPMHSYWPWQQGIIFFLTKSQNERVGFLPFKRPNSFLHFFID